MAALIAASLATTAPAVAVTIGEGESETALVETHGFVSQLYQSARGRGAMTQDWGAFFVKTTAYF